MIYTILSIALSIALSVIFVLFFIERKNAKVNKEEVDSKITKVNKDIVSINKNIVGVKETVELSKNEANERINITESSINENKHELESVIQKTFKELDNRREESLTNINKVLGDMSSSINENKRESESVIQKTFKELNNRREESLTNINKVLGDMSSSFNEKIVQLANTIDSIAKENMELRKKLEFFTEIESDSKKLNEIEDESKKENTIQKALEEIKNGFDFEFPQAETTNVQVLSNDSVEETEDKVKASIETAFETKTIISKKKEENKHLNVLDEEQRSAFDAMNNTNNNLFITGKAGTGKSFLLEIFVRATNKKVLKLAPTGISALNIHGVTLHSALGYHNLENATMDELNRGVISLKAEKKIVVKAADVIIIDEISMVRADKFDRIDKILRGICDSNLPFGGKQIIVFGDLFQLPPIVKFDERQYLLDNYNGVYFFNSKAYMDNNFKLTEFTINHRQKGDSRFFEILNRIREGSVTSKDLSILNTRSSFDKNELRRVITLFPTKVLADEKNKNELNKIEAKEYSYNAVTILNVNNDQNKNLEAVFPISSILKLKIGALVMMTANDIEKRWVNGTLGIVSYLHDTTIKVLIDGNEYEVKPEVFTEQEATYKNGEITYKDIFSVSQYPILLAYAITIHKSQGMTYQRIACDVSNCFTTGQAYVALSRCSSLNGLFLLNEIHDERSIQVDSVIKDFYLNYCKTKKV